MLKSITIKKHKAAKRIHLWRKKLSGSAQKLLGEILFMQEGSKLDDPNRPFWHCSLKNYET